MILPFRIPLVAVLLITLALTKPVVAAPETERQTKVSGQPKDEVLYNRDIRPILSDNCYACHGPDENKRKAKLRLDLKEEAFKEAKSGGFAIVPGHTEKSLLLKRLLETDPDEVMPPPETGKKLTAEQVGLLRRWIEQGAKWEGHWAYLRPERPASPEVKNPSWPRNAIDRFILARLEKEGLHPSPEADQTTLVRRLSFDLTGLPPTVEEVDQFLADKSSEAYDKLVDRLIASKQYGERMAQHWLDLARYADTNGYHIDNHRDMWIWREWVINAFNRNLPFDQFTIEQLAGDLLPNATLDQRIASGFNRNHMVNFEGGADPAEYHSKYLVDRVSTTATVWMGTTIACAECHDHKFDPISTKDFYQFYAFFNNVPEKGLDGHPNNPEPSLKIPSTEQSVQLIEYLKQIPEAERVVKDQESKLPEAQATWEKEVLAKLSKPPEPDGLLAYYTFDETLSGIDALGAVKEGSYRNTNTAPAWVEGKLGKAVKFDGEEDYLNLGASLDFERTNSFSFGLWAKLEGTNGVLLGKIDEASSIRGFDLELQEGKLVVHLINSWPDNALEVRSKDTLTTNIWHHVMVTYDGSSKGGGIKIYAQGKAQRLDIKKDTLTDTIRNQARLQVGKTYYAFPFRGIIDDLRFYNRALKPEEVKDLAGRANLALVSIPADKRTEEQKADLRKYFRENHASDLKNAEQELAKAQKSKEDLLQQIPSTMVMKELDNARDTFILVRGNFQNKGEKVSPGVPKAFSPQPDGTPTNRLALAKWLVSPDHPLTARVTVNRYWQMLFGTGILKTSNDFGSQGDWPSHPELLDWLATEFMARNWDVKSMLKLIVTSATYRQASTVTPQLLERDPYNRLLTRGPRFRLDAEMIRDNALAVSGLLNRRIGGESVRPYQPPGLWEAVSFSKDFSSQSYEQSKGQDLYRRGLYIYIKRSMPYPPLTTFDAPNREVCTTQRPRTSTPLQALVLLNDPCFVEAARALAQKIMKEGGTETSTRLAYAFRLALARPPTQNELEVLQRIYEQQFQNFQKDKEAATGLISVGGSPRPKDLADAELAAWTAIGNILLNLDETITKG